MIDLRFFHQYNSIKNGGAFLLHLVTSTLQNCPSNKKREYDHLSTVNHHTCH